MAFPSSSTPALTMVNRSNTLAAHRHPLLYADAAATAATTTLRFLELKATSISINLKTI